MRKSKIVITLGPATESKERIKELIGEGVDIFRLNFSHATHEYHKQLIANIREAGSELGQEVAILQDISGPKIRISHLQTPIHLQAGDILTLSKSETDEAAKVVSLSYPEIIDSIKVGEMIYISDGTIRVKVVDKEADALRCEVVVPNLLQSKKGVNFPNSTLHIDTITPKDKSDMEFGAAFVDLVAISFVRSAEDIRQARKILQANDAGAMIFAKIETKEAIEQIDAILEEADGIMVARGDMGVELGVERVPPLQKMLVQKANAASKPVIIATQMLTSMIESPYPTRAEISDIANAVLDGADALMLSDETTVGNHPVETVRVLADSIVEAEKIYPYYKFDEVSEEESISSAAAMIAKNLDPAAFVVFTRSGKSAKTLSKFRTDKQILATSYSVKTLRQLKAVWGVTPTYLSSEFNNSDELQYAFIKRAVDEGWIDIKKKYIFTFGYPLATKYPTNVIRVMERESFNYLFNKFE